MENKINSRYLILALAMVALCLCLSLVAIGGWLLYPKLVSATVEAEDDLASQVEQTVVAQVAALQSTTDAGTALAVQVEQTVAAQIAALQGTATPTTAAAAPKAPAASPTPTTVAAAPNAPAAPSPTTIAPSPTKVAPSPTTAAPSPTSIPPSPTTVPPSPTTAAPSLTQLEKTSWQVDFAYIGGSFRLQVSFTQTGGVLSGSNRDNNAEVDIITNGTVTGNNVEVTFTMTNGGSPRGSVTCTGVIAGSPQTISGSFTAPSELGVGSTSGNCSFR